jgi:hypothetical protein
MCGLVKKVRRVAPHWNDQKLASQQGILEALQGRLRLEVGIEQQGPVALSMVPEVTRQVSRRHSIRAVTSAALDCDAQYTDNPTELGSRFAIDAPPCLIFLLTRQCTRHSRAELFSFVGQIKAVTDWHEKLMFAVEQQHE